MFWWELLVIGAAFVAWVVILHKPAKNFWKKLQSRKGKDETSLHRP